MYRNNSTQNIGIDNLKAADAYQKINHPKKEAFVELSKQKVRQFKDLVSHTDAYSNIARDNARADYLKKLLNPDIV